MKERPILFSAPMVRALLAGTKTQTRRAIKAPDSVSAFRHFHEDRWDRMQGIARGDTVRCPYGQPGDRLWVRETFRRDLDRMNRCKVVEYRADDAVLLASPGPGGAFDFPDLGWRPSIHMPRWASRITLEITGVRVEKLQDISEADAVAEGCTKNHNGYYLGGPHAVSGRKQMATAKSAYRDVWESINGTGSWEANPWVWAIEFKRLEGGAA